MLDLIIQVIVGLLIVAGIHMFSMWIMRTDKIVIDKKSTTAKAATQVTTILDGYVDAASFSNKAFNTVDAASPLYLPMPRSANRKGGAQFSYSFWMHLSSSATAAAKERILFIKGDPTPYKLRKVEVAPSGESVVEAVDNQPVVYCPMIKFGGSHTDLEVWFNSLTNLRERVVFSSVVSDNSSQRRNLASLVPDKWVMLTFVFEDNVPINDFEDGIRVSFYVNDVAYQVAKVRGTLRQNNGHFVLFPEQGGIQGLKMGDLRYYSYAVDPSEVKTAYVKGPPKHYNTSAFGKSINQTLQLSTYNTVDLYNL